MSIVMGPIAKFLFRIMFIGTGLMAFALSFFHGFDLNLLFFVGILLILIGLIPYGISSQKMKVWAVGLVILSLGVYVLFLVSLFIDPSLVRPVGITDIVILMPLIGMVYLLVIFSASRPHASE